jgi:hypothetical protein
MRAHASLPDPAPSVPTFRTAGDVVTYFLTLRHGMSHSGLSLSLLLCATQLPHQYNFRPFAVAFFSLLLLQKHYLWLFPCLEYLVKLVIEPLSLSARQGSRTHLNTHR